MNLEQSNIGLGCNLIINYFPLIECVYYPNIALASTTHSRDKIDLQLPDTRIAAHFVGVGINSSISNLYYFQVYKRI
jgi:hypothetical protein